MHVNRSIHSLLKILYCERHRTFAILSVSLLIFLSAGMHAMHNHSADLKEHHDCPVYKLELVLSSAIIPIAVTLYVYVKIRQLVIVLKELMTILIISSIRQRAPPRISNHYLK